LLVTAIAAGVSLLPHDVHVTEALVAISNWIPTAFLVLVGTMNLRLLRLLRRRDVAFAPAEWKLKLVPQRLRLHASLWAR
jgi:high-affinity nickel-transport protein